MTEKKRTTKPSEHEFSFSDPLKAAIKANRLLHLIHWRMAGQRQTWTDNYYPINICAAFLFNYLESEIYPAYWQACQFHHSNRTVRQAQILYLTLYLKNRKAPPTKREMDEVQGWLWSRFGVDSGLDQPTFSNFIWRVTKKPHLILFVEAQPGQFHLLYGQVEKSPGQESTWAWTDLAQHSETGRIEPVLMDLALFVR